MIAEQLEFQISQYADGTLSPAETQALDQILRGDAEARKLLADYRQLNARLARSAALPSLRWDRLADRISSNISAQQTRPMTLAIAGRISTWSAGLKIAAAMLLACTAWLMVRHRSTAPVPNPSPAVSVTAITGPQAEVANGPAVTDVSVGPSQLAQRTEATRNGEAVVVEPSRVVISGLTPPVKRDPHLR